jgi:hypothetical protein
MISIDRKKYLSVLQYTKSGLESPRPSFLSMRVESSQESVDHGSDDNRSGDGGSLKVFDPDIRETGRLSCDDVNAPANLFPVWGSSDDLPAP